MTSLFLRWSTLYLWLHIFSPNLAPIAVLLADFIAKIVLHIYWFHGFRNIKAWQIFDIVCFMLNFLHTEPTNYEFSRIF